MLHTLPFDAKEVVKLKARTKLNIITTALEPGQPVAFKVSLKGLAAHSAVSRS